MELDKTAIVLRQRPLLDLIDLSLVVLRVYWKPLLAYAAIGVVPFCLINFFVLRSLNDYDSILLFDNQILEEFPLRVRYVFFLSGLVCIQTPIAMLGVTYYLGQALFLKQPSFQEFRSTLAVGFAGLLLILGLFRFGFLAFLAVGLLASNVDFDVYIEIFWLGMVLMGTVVSLRAFGPFAPEILILEQSPLRVSSKAKASQSISYFQRSRSLHGQMYSDLFGRMLAISLALGMTLIAITLSELIFSGIFFGVWTWEWWMDRILFPLNLWLVALWGTVFRFLSYLDCRTRLEGWELDLRLRAEARRFSGAAE